MAGIGFELRKIMRKGERFSYIKTYLFSSIVTVGPTLMCILLITFFQLLMIYKHVHISKREYFMISTMYCFVFSMVITGIFNMPLSRYVSDMIYKEKTNKILPSMFGAIAICLLLGGIPVGIFYYMINCSFLDKLMMYLLFAILVVIWIEMIYISALKDYISIVRGFAIGVLIGLITGIVLIIINIFELNQSIIFSILLGFTIISILFMKTLINSFDLNIGNDYFEFFKSFDKYKILIATSFLLTFGVYIHNIVFWFSKIGIKIYNAFYAAPNYDIASFFAFLSVMPSLVIFAVSMETSFYKKFKEFLLLIENGASLDEINLSKKEVAKVFVNKLRTLMEIQLFFTLASLTFGIFIMPTIGLPSISVNIFMNLSIGYYFYICMYVVILIILYLDDQKGSLYVTVVFFALNVLFTYISTFANEVFYGIGFSVASLISLIFSYFRLKSYFNHLEYYIFRSGEFDEKLYSGIFTKIYGVIEGGTKVSKSK